MLYCKTFCTAVVMFMIAVQKWCKLRPNENKNKMEITCRPYFLVAVIMIVTTGFDSN